MKTIETNQGIARRAIEEIWNQHNLDAVDALYADNYVTRDLRRFVVLDRAGLKELIGQAIADAPNVHLSIDLMLAGGDKVAMRYTARNGHAETATGALHVQIVGGKIKESWGAPRMAALLRRIGSTNA
jgi:predicted SnoaL-like aldol condensation-catalyzing enzyme